MFISQSTTEKQKTDKSVRENGRITPFFDCRRSGWLLFITCALVSLRTGAPQDVATVIAECHAEILVGHKVMPLGSQLLSDGKQRQMSQQHQQQMG
jgi:hypothetical protein